MTAEQQAAEAFDREWQHALKALPPRPCLSDHSAVLKHRRSELGIRELLQYYSKKLPAYLFGPRLLSCGAHLTQERQDHRIAQLCCQRLADLNLPASSPDSKLDVAGRLALHVRALYGLHAAQAAEALREDGQLHHQHTVAAVLSALAGLQAACQLAMPAQPMVVHEGTQHIHSVAVRLLSAPGLHAQVLPHMLFAVRAMECHVSLGSMQLLPWRVQLYATAAVSYYNLISSTGQDGGTSDAASAVPPAHDSASTGITATAEAATAILAAGLSQLASIARAQSLDAVPAPDVTAAVQAAQAQLVLLQCLFEQRQPAAAAGAEQAAAAVSQFMASIKPIGSSAEQLAALVRLLQSSLAAHGSPLHQLQLPANLQPAMAAAAQLAAEVLRLDAGDAQQDSSGASEAASAHVQLHKELLLVSYRYQQQDLLQKLVSAALSRAAGAALPGTTAAAGCCSDLEATAAVLDAVCKLQESPGETTTQALAAVLVQHSLDLGSACPRFLAAAAQELHAAASSVLQGCFSLSDSNAELVQGMLEGLHAALQHSGHANGVLKGTVALRLASILEEQEQHSRGLKAAQQGLAAVVAARCEALTHLQGEADEHMRWISGCRTQPDAATAALLEGMSDKEQVLACLHADALLLKSRLALKLGMQEAACKATARQQRLKATLQKRDQQADIFGARTRKERRLDAAAVEGAGRMPATAVEVEQRLLLECGHCPYQRATVLTATAMTQPDSSRQAALLEEACDALQAAHAAEAELFASQQPPAAALRPLSAHHLKPANPKVLRRTPNSICLAPFPVQLARDAGRKPAAFAAYCKAAAAGVSLTANKTSTEYPGSGVQVPIDGRVTIEGLQGGEAYNFAVSVFDDQGELIGELGASSPAIVMTLPLPVYYCYAQVLLTAARLGLWTVVKTAAAALIPRFFSTTATRPVWQAHPADRFTVQQEQLARQVAPFLRLLVQAVYAYAGHLGAMQLAELSTPGSSSWEGGEESGGSSSNGLVGTAASRALLLQVSETRLPQQVAVLEAAQRHLLAMQVAAHAGDEVLVEEGALRTFNLLRPLLQQQDVSPAMFQPLSELHTLLAAVRDTAPHSVSGHKQQRQQAAQALATAGFWKLRLLEPVGPSLACGSAAVAAHVVLGLQLKPSAALSALDGALLQVLSGRVAGASTTAHGASSPSDKAGKAGGKKQAGNKAGKKVDRIPEAAASSGPAVGESEQAEELAALQEMLLWHPRGALWAADLHASRCDDVNDLVAQVLPKLEQPHALATCWPLLSDPAPHSHPKWLPLCVLLMQAAAKQHGAALWLSLPTADKGAAAGSTAAVGTPAESLPEAARGAASPQLTAAAAAASELLQAVQQHMRMAARRPQFLSWPSSPKWTVEAGAAALEAEGFALGDQGTAAGLPQPQLPAGATAAATKAAMASWQQLNADMFNQERRRLAAALLLQQRLPVLMARRAIILTTRRQLAAWAPWLAELHRVVGSMAAEAAAQLLALKVPAAAVVKPVSDADASLSQPADGTTLVPSATATIDAADPAASVPTPAEAASSTPEADAAVAASGTAPLSEGTAAPAANHTPPSRSGSPQKAGGAQPSAAASAKADTLDNLAQLLTLQAHQQFTQAATLSARGGSHQQLYSLAKQLQPITTYLLTKLPALLAPAPAVTWDIRPLPEDAVPPLLAVAADRTSLDAAGGKGAERRSIARGKAADRKPPVSATTKGVAGRPTGGTPRADARHTLQPEPRGLHIAPALRAVTVALLAGLQQARSQLRLTPPATADSSNRGTAAATHSYATSFSFGSDAQVECWHTGSGIDVAGLTQALATVLRALSVMGRQRCMLELGVAWLEVTQGSADAALVPLLLPAANNLGSAADVAALAAAQQVLADDRNVALEELNRVRALVVESLQGVPPLEAPPGNSLHASSSPLHAAGTAVDPALLPGEYGRVVSQLRKRGENGHMILALNELGDVHAHLGNWPQAAEAWSGAVDALLGPYHVVDTWRQNLDLTGSPADLLRRYGVHGMLLAATILGKLARYSYHGDLGSRLSCALLAAELLPGVFAGDLVHPQRRLDFAAYVPVELCPGVDVFDDAYRCNAAVLASSLECLTGILQEQQLHLLALPLLALWEHTSLHIAHNRASTVLARITRVRVLAALGLMPQAAAVLSSVMQGANLPGLVLGPPQPLLGAGNVSAAAPGSGGHHQQGKAAKGHAAAEGKAEGQEAREGVDPAEADGQTGGGLPQLYAADRWPKQTVNDGFLQHVAEAVLDPAVTPAYGPWLSGHLSLARAAFLAAAGGAVDCWVDGKPSALAAAVRAGPPPAADPSAAASSAAASNEAAASHGAAAGAPAAGAKGGKPPAAGAAAAAGMAGAAAGKAAAAVPSTPPPPARTPEEFKLLDAAAHLLREVVSTSCCASSMSAVLSAHIPWAGTGGVPAPAEHGKAKAATGKAVPGKDKPSSSTGKGGHGGTAKGGKASPQRHGKGATGRGGHKQQQQEPEQPDGADTAAAERRAAAAAELLAVQHQQLLVEALLQLAAVQSARWLPLQALPLCLAACEAVRHAVGSSGAGSSSSFLWAGSPLDGSQAESKAALQPGSSTWLASRWQLARVLLQLQHHGPCAGVCLKALTDAARAADTAWSARLLHTQALALAAQEKHLQALNCFRTALARLDEAGLPASMALPLQLDYAALCDEVGARGDFDRLSGANLGASTAAVHDLGLAEIMEHPKLTSIYLPAAASHLTALLAAASAATRRRQLATAERHLRAAADMLGCCRCTPVAAAAVLTQLARVLRLQAALQLPDTSMLGAAAQLPALEPAGQQQQQLMSTTTGSSHRSSSGAILGGNLQQRRLHEAAHLLGLSLRVQIADAGSNPVLVRAVLLELAAVLLQAAAGCETPGHGQGSLSSSSNSSSAAGAAVASKVAAVLRAAHVTAGQISKLFLESHSLQPVQSPGTSLPDWLLELARGHEQLQLSMQQEAAAAADAIASRAQGKKPARSAAAAATATVGTTGSAATAAASTAGGKTAGGDAGATVVSDAALGRMSVCFYLQQLAATASGAAGLQQQRTAAEQALLLQPALRAACARFAADCCWPGVPSEVAAVLHSLTAPVPAPAPNLTPGAVITQWYRQDGCWQAPTSWACHGTLPPSGQLGWEALGSLPKQQPCISCLYVLALPPQPLTEAAGAAAAAAGGGGGAGMPSVVLRQGELVVGLERAKRVQLQVKAMRIRLENPGKPTDIFAKPAPSTAELAAVKHSLECLLAAVPEDDMPPPPADLPPPLQPAQAGSTAVAAAAAATPAAGSKGTGPAGAAAAATAGKPAPVAKTSAAGGAAGAGAAAAAGKAVGAVQAAAAGSGSSSSCSSNDGSAVQQQQLEWRQAATWAKAELLLDLEGGLQATDVGLAVWLGVVLQGLRPDRMAPSC